MWLQPCCVWFWGVSMLQAKVAVMYQVSGTNLNRTSTMVVRAHFALHKEFRLLEPKC